LAGDGGGLTALGGVCGHVWEDVRDARVPLVVCGHVPAYVRDVRAPLVVCGHVPAYVRDVRAPLVVCGHVPAYVRDVRAPLVVCRHVPAYVPGKIRRGPVDNLRRLRRDPGTLDRMAAQMHEAELDVRKPFSRADARRAGIPVRHLTSTRFRKLFYDLYIGADLAVTPAVLASAALRISPAGSHASHFTAAEIWGGVVPDQPLTHVSSPHGCTRSERQGVGSHETRRGSQVVVFRQLRVSSPEQTFIDLATELTLVDLVVLGDSLVKMRRTTTRKIVEAAVAWKGKGSRLARRAAHLVRAGVDSPMETRLRMLMVLAGLPEPVVNHIEYDAMGAWAKRFDLSYPDLLLIIEYDGRQHAEDDRQWGRDIDRREELDADGWRLIVVRSTGIYTEPGRTLERIVDAMRSCGARGLPRNLTSEWERYFPGR
jgi:Protein of unknown function (DUF559)